MEHPAENRSNKMRKCTRDYQCHYKSVSNDGIEQYVTAALLPPNDDFNTSYASTIVYWIVFAYELTLVQSVIHSAKCN